MLRLFYFRLYVSYKLVVIVIDMGDIYCCLSDIMNKTFVKKRKG